MVGVKDISLMVSGELARCLQCQDLKWLPGGNKIDNGVYPYSLGHTDQLLQTNLIPNTYAKKPDKNCGS